MYGGSLGWNWGFDLPFGMRIVTPPPIEEVKKNGLNCAGLANLYLRASGICPPQGGTISYWDRYGTKSNVFNVSKDYKAGTIIGRKYRDGRDQGHLAICTGNGMLMEAIPHVGVITCSIRESNEITAKYFNLDTDYYEWTYFPH